MVINLHSFLSGQELLHQPLSLLLLGNNQLLGEVNNVIPDG